MTGLRRWWRNRRDPRVGEELRFHRDSLVERYIAAGMAPADASRRAAHELGNVVALEDDVKDVRGRWLDDAVRDVCYGVRTLRRSREFTTAAAASLALAMGAGIAMFSVLYAVLLRPLPYRDAGQLAMLWTEDPTQNLRENRSSLWDVQQWRTHSRTFTDIAAFDGMSTTLLASDGAEQIAGAVGTPNLLSVLGVQPVQGRDFSVDDVERPVVLISHRFWQGRFGGSPHAIGASLVLNGIRALVIGVLPADFPVATLDADVWVPRAMAATERGPGTWFAVGRLRPGATVDRAQAEMTTLARRLNEPLPGSERNRGIAVIPLSLYAVGSQSRLALWLLGGAVLCVLLIAAANTTSLSLARSVARTRELAVRMALGAGRGRIVRQLITEGVILTVGSGVIGTLLALGALRFIRAFGPATLVRLEEAGLDARVLTWALTISLLTGAMVGLLSAITALRHPRLPGGDDGRTVSGRVATTRIRRALVVAEMTLAIVLLVGAGLLIRSWQQVTNIDSGFRPERVLMMELSSPATFTDLPQRADLYQRVLDQIQAVPGVEHAGLIGDLFISNSREQVVTVERSAGVTSERLRFAADEVSADFFTAVGTPLRRGRFFTTADGAGLPVAIVNDSMAQRSWPGQNPIGRRFKLGPLDSERPWLTVVGVVGDVRRQGLERDVFPQIFVPFARNPPRSVDLFIRTSSDDPLAMAGAVRTAVRRAEKDAPIYGVASLDAQLGRYLAQRRFQMSVLTAFAAVALLMAAVGIYGLVQYSIAMRTREIGVRMAVGARAGDIFRMIVGEGLTLSITGLAFGLAGAWWLGRVGSSLLFGVSASDPLTLVSVSLVLAAVATAACYFPARRAMRVDPIAALR